MIEFELLNKAGLEAFVHSNSFSTLKNLPISKHRALSQLLNPRAADEDVLLILAWENGELVGYAGILPDLMDSSAENPVRFGWFSCVWVDATQRGKNIGLQLLQKALDRWDGRLIGADYAPETLRMYLKTGVFAEPLAKEGIRLYNRVDLQTILPPKKSFFQKIKPLLRISDAIANAVLDIRWWLPRRNKSQLRAEAVSSIDREANDFITDFQSQSLFQRAGDDLNWILHNPWVLAGTPNDDSRRYYFSSVDRSFEFHGFKLRNSENRLIALLVFSKRNRILKLPYCFIAAGMLPEVVRFIESFIIDARVNSFTTFHPELSVYLASHKTVGLFKKPITRRYMVSLPMMELIADSPRKIQDGDGDCAFT